MAEEVFAVCTMMDHMYSLGDGRLLARCAAEATNTPLRSGVMPGGTRKAVSLTREPGHLLHNFKAYAAAMHARMEWRREGHNTYTAKALVDAGRRLTSVDFI